MCAKSRFFTKNEEKFKKNNAKGMFSCATCGKTVKKYLETFVFFQNGEQIHELWKHMQRRRSRDTRLGAVRHRIQDIKGSLASREAKLEKEVTFDARAAERTEQL